MTIAERVKAVRARALIRRWEYRQRNLAHGAWDRFRAALAHARDAYAIDEATAAALLAEGFAADERGRGLEPPRTIVWVTAERAARLVGARSLVLRLDAELLAAQYLALVPFP
jgi:MoxR-like ATPase